MPLALPRCSSLPLASPVLHALAMKCFVSKDVGKFQKGERCSDAWKKDEKGFRSKLCGTCCRASKLLSCGVTPF